MRVGGVGRGWRRPLHRLILETRSGGKFDTARGCHLELTRSRVDVATNSTSTKLDLAGNNLNSIYDVWRDSVIKNWPDRYRQNIAAIDAEVFSPNTCAVYLVPEPYQNPIDPKTLNWIPGETTATRGRGMELIYQSEYKRKEAVGGDQAKCSWVSIKRVNGAKPEDRCQEIVCIFMGSEHKLRSQFLEDLAKIPDTVQLFGRQPN